MRLPLILLGTACLMASGCQAYYWGQESKAYEREEARWKAHMPTWSNATPYQRTNGYCIPDDAYYASQQYQDDLKKSADTIIRLRQQLGKSPP